MTDFVPAFGFHWLTPLYDPLTRGTLPVKRRLVAQAEIPASGRVLDVGCGSGALVSLVKRGYPDASVAGVDVDPKILAIARRKLAGLDVDLRLGRLADVGFEPESFDRVLTTYVLHHLSSEEKVDILRTIRGLLRPGGSLHIADFGVPATLLMRAVSTPVRWLDRGRLAPHFAGQIPDLLRTAGFTSVSPGTDTSSPIGTITLWTAT